MNIIEGKLQLRGDEKVAIITSRFNELVTNRLTEGARDCFLRHGGNEDLLDLILVPGAYEIPFALQKILSQSDYDGICCLGAIIRGSTPHFDYVSAEAIKGIANVTIKYGAALPLGVLTTDTIEQAIERAGTKSGNKGFESMSGLIELINLYQNLGV